MDMVSFLVLTLLVISVRLNQAKRCADPGISRSIRRLTDFTSNGFAVGAKLRYYCLPKFILTGARLLKCKRNGKWSLPPPTCKEPKCNQAVLPPHSYVIRPKTWKHSTNYGVRFILGCNPGYSRIHLAGSLICDTPDWKLFPNSFKCFAKNCGDPGRLRHGDRKGLYTFGEKVTFSCKHCYKLNGPSYRNCQANQKWSDDQPTCEPAQCAWPQPPQNGHVYVKSQQCDAKANYRCNQGYSLDGPAKRTCQSDETWSGKEPSCKQRKPQFIPTTLPSTTNPPYTTRPKLLKNMTSRLHLSTKMYQPTKTTTKTLIKTSTKTTNPTNPTPTLYSLQSPCGYPNLPVKARVVVIRGKVIHLGCKAGYSLLARGILICYKDNKWRTYRKLQCLQTGCSNPGVPKYGYKKGSSYQYGDVVTFLCDKCYKLLGHSQRICLTNRTWTNTQPTCQVITCPNIKMNNETTVGYSSRECGATARYTCMDQTTIPLGSRERRCDEKGLWTGDEPKCIDSNLNIALNQPTQQSSNHYYWKGPSYRAVNGNRNSYYNRASSCTHTKKQKGAWWRVDLGEKETVGMVIVVNRGNCCSDRLNGFIITVGDSIKDGGRSNALCGGKSTPGRGETVKIKCSKPLRGRYVSVLLPKNKPNILTLCEVEVYRIVKY